jgi:GntR family transcriptional regulator
MTLSDRGPVPLYQQIAAELAARIKDGTYGPGDRLPSEPELMAEFGVAQITARKAHRVLRDEGLADIVKGRGTFVTGAAA